MKRQKVSNRKNKLPLKVLMFPTFHGANMYGPALVDSIKQEALDLKYISRGGKFFPLMAVIRAINLLNVVHLHWIDIYTIKVNWYKTFLSSVIYILSLLIVKVLGIKIVWTIHDYINLEGRFPEFDILIRRFTAKLADAIIVHTKAAQHEIEHLYKLSDTDRRKLRVIPLGTYIGLHKNNISRTDARRRLGLDEDLFLFGFFGYIRPYKGVPQLINAFHQMDGDNINLLIAGLPLNESLRRVVTEAAKEDSRIHLRLTFIEEEEFQILLNAVDVVVLPFIRSLTSSSLMLAMSFGKAVVVSNCASVSEVLPSKGGLIYENEKPKDLIRALCEIQEMDVVSMGQKNLERAEVFDWQSIARATIQVYSEVLGNSTTKSMASGG